MKRFADLPAGARALWAKSGEAGGHGLLAHMVDVAAVAEAILCRESRRTRAWAANSFGLSLPLASRFLAAMCGLHDFGKAIPGFQAKWEEGRRAGEAAGLVFGTGALKAVRHDLATAVLLPIQLAHVFPGAAWPAVIARALGAHHGYFPRPDELKEGKPLFEGSEWACARAALLEAYLAALRVATTPSAIEIALPPLAWLAGLATVADWVASNPEWFPSGERSDLIFGHYGAARELADRALDEIGWPRFALLHAGDGQTNSLVGRMLGPTNPAITARPLQQAADRLLAKATGPALLMVEAPMGEGKTELAFLAHLRLQSANEHRGLYFALPTQATGNALFDRAVRFIEAFSSEVRVDIQLAHGGAMFDERLPRLRDVNASRTESIASSAWFSKRKRPLLSPYGVGTVDQALFATLHVKHHFVRLWGLANRVVVLDEVHAYDTYTSGLIDALLRWLRAMNCSVVLMSATLPARRRAALLASWGVANPPAIAYPRLLVASDRDIHGEHVACRTLAPIEIAGLPEDLDSVASAALQALSGGGCGVVVVNTVERAQNLYRSLQGRVDGGRGLLLFHARSPADQRREMEIRVLGAFGNGPQARRPACALLVATQVVEQSVDIDFDFMISDLAPIDLLLQRVGRLHRHRRQRPEAHAVPRLLVAGMRRDRLPEVAETAWAYVYDRYILYRTWAVLGVHALWQLPDDIDRLVQRVYDTEDLLEDAERVDMQGLMAIDRAYGESRAAIQDQERRSRNAAIDAAVDPRYAYDNPRGDEEASGFDGLRAVTRLGEDGVVVVPLLKNADGYRLQAGETPFSLDIEVDGALASRLYRRQVRLSRKDLVMSFRQQPLPKAFEAHPLLCNLHPLVLRDGVAEIGNVRIRLDTELGITFEPINARADRQQSSARRIL